MKLLNGCLLIKAGENPYRQRPVSGTVLAVPDYFYPSICTTTPGTYSAGMQAMARQLQEGKPEIGDTVFFPEAAATEIANGVLVKESDLLGIIKKGHE